MTTLARDAMSQESNLAFPSFVIMFKEKGKKVMKMMHEVSTEIHGIIKYDKHCSRCSNRLQIKSVSHTGLIKIVIGAK